VVLISYNRGAMLRKVVEGYGKQTVAVDLFVHDNGSDDPETLAVLDLLERDGVQVFRRGPISSPEELNLVDESVQEIFRHRDPSPYAVSDCDISLDESSPETLAMYLAVLEAMPEVECVGPMLRIDDVPPSYSLYVPMINRHVGRFWSQEPKWATVQGQRVAYQRAAIDTTLAVHRAGTPFRRMRNGVRLYHPYDAQHLDWYPDEHESAYRASADGSAVSNWSNPARERANRQLELKHRQYRDVVRAEDGSLVAVTRRVAVPSPAADVLLALVEGVREELVTPWADLLGRSRVQDDSVGVLELELVPSERLGVHLVPGDHEWQAFVVAGTEDGAALARAAGLTETSAHRFAVETFAVGEDDLPRTAHVASAYHDVLSRLTGVASAPSVDQDTRA
jgi:hypothetical protein